MAFHSTSDNLLNNIVLNTNNLDKGDFPSLVGLIVASTGIGNFIVRTREDLAASGAYVFQGDVPVQDIVVFQDVNPSASPSRFTSDIDAFAVSLIEKAAEDYLSKTGGNRAWIKIRKIEFSHLYTGATTIPANSTATYKLSAEIYNQD